MSSDDLIGTALTRDELLRRGAVVGLALSIPGVSAADALAAKPKIKMGGRLRVAVTGGGLTETLDPNQLTAEMDTARSRSLFEGLTDFDAKGKVYGKLAEEYSSDGTATKWKFKIRKGVEFHNGKTLTAQDVAKSLRYILNPANKSKGLAPLADLDPNSIRARDKSTLEFALVRPNSFIDAILGDLRVRVFYGNPAGTPIGTGPFKFKNWTRGQRSLFVAHKDYRDGPYLNEVEYIAINDASARLTALGSRQVDAISQLDPSLVSLAVANKHIRVLDSPGGSFTTLCMQLDKAPFTDARVRQAFKLMTNRGQMLVNVLQGHGRTGNDLPCWFDPDYASKIPQRKYDPDQAKSLLRSAGQENLAIELLTSDFAPAAVQSATLFKEQAKQAGVDVSIRQLPASQYIPVRRQHAFHIENWGGRPLASYINLAYLTTSVFNTTNYKVPAFDNLIARAFATPAGQRRRQLMVDAQQMIWDTGGDVVWGFLGSIDGASTRVRGIKSSVIRNFGNYELEHVWLA